jgi:hypothetical protein
MLVVRGRRIVFPDGERPASLHIEHGVISAIRAFDAVGDTSHSEIVEAGDLVVMPGLVDSHVHVNEPGRTDWEGFDTATRAAAAGGITTIVDMPLNSIPATTDVEALEVKRAAARGRCHVDVAFWGGIVPGNADAIAPLADAGVRGFNVFSRRLAWTSSRQSAKTISGALCRCSRTRRRDACRSSCTPRIHACCATRTGIPGSTRPFSRPGRLQPRLPPSNSWSAWPPSIMSPRTSSMCRRRRGSTSCRRRAREPARHR